MSPLGIAHWQHISNNNNDYPVLQLNKEMEFRFNLKNKVNLSNSLLLLSLILYNWLSNSFFLSPSGDREYYCSLLHLETYAHQFYIQNYCWHLKRYVWCYTPFFSFSIPFRLWCFKLHSITITRSKQLQ